MEASAFKKMFLPAHRRLFAMALRLTGSPEEAEDLVQETYLRLWTKRFELKDMDRPEGFAVTTLRNIFIDSTRKNKPLTCDIGYDAMRKGTDEDTEKHLVAAEAHHTVMRLIDSLPEKQRQVMVMRDVNDMDYDDICRQTGIPPSTVRSLISRARKFVRDQFRMLSDKEKQSE